MASAAQSAPASRRALLAWALYDWANSPFAAVIVTFVFAAYFARGIATDEVTGTAQWGWAMALSGLVVALLSPVLGAMADAGGRRKPWLAGFTVLGALAVAASWWAAPDPAFVLLALVTIGIANAALDLAQVFHNAWLADLAPRASLGRWSGASWGLGYMGGLAALVILLLGFVQADPPPFGLDAALAEHVRIVGPFVAVWLLLFTLPLLVLTPDHRAARPQPVRLGPAFREVGRTLKSLPRTPNLLRFLLARLVYNDGLTTLFAFGGIYAAGTFGMDLDEIILFGIVLNVTAGLGAFAMAPLDDRIGSKPTILLALGGLMVCGLVALVATDKSLFWIAGSALGLFVGPAQAASRTMMARLAPAERRAELFGFYALTGKVTAPLGPFLFGTLTWLFATQRAGMASVLFMFVLGTVLLTTVREPGRSAPEPAVGGP